LRGDGGIYAGMERNMRDRGRRGILVAKYLS
jgi:hypothetical protein